MTKKEISLFSYFDYYRRLGTHNSLTVERPMVRGTFFLILMYTNLHLKYWGLLSGHPVYRISRLKVSDREICEFE